MKQSKQNQGLCWLCSHSVKNIYRRKVVSLDSLTSEHFKITDSTYGLTLPLFKCQKCGFLQTEDFEPTAFYRLMVDEEYEETRAARLNQEALLIKRIIKLTDKKKLLDVGAGSGILIEAAKNLGFTAKGIEPSEWLSQIAKSKNLDVFQGTLSTFRDSTDETYDIITIVDVIEHVHNPLELIDGAKQLLNKDGLLLIVTPNRQSLVARLLAEKWWHYRVAHIGYFSKDNLEQAGEKCGLKVISSFSPAWYFPVTYILKRLAAYIYFDLNNQMPNFIRTYLIKLNLFDSVGIFFKSKK